MLKKDLLAQINRNLASTPPPVEAPPPPPPPPADSPAPAPQAAQPKAASPKRRAVAAVKGTAPAAITTGSTAGSSKAAGFWLDDEDRAIFHEMGMLLYSQGIKPSHNIVLRAAIRMVPRDHQLVEQVRLLMEKDGRKLRHQKPDPS